MTTTVNIFISNYTNKAGLLRIKIAILYAFSRILTDKTIVVSTVEQNLTTFTWRPITLVTTRSV